jgi:4,5-DOPA dioxygenase extradiol
MMPVLFVGHGSPMNAIEVNDDSSEWAGLGKRIPKPKAIVCVSAHWYTQGTRVLTSVAPRTIHDFSGFPERLYRVSYPAQGSPELASRIIELLEPPVTTDSGWGLDHGTWSVLVHMYPQADIPTIQLSIDARATPQQLYALGNALRPLRQESVLILGSGNIVHNLGLVDFSKPDGFDWADEFDDYIKRGILDVEHESVLDYHMAGTCADRAFRTREHFDPLLIVLGASRPDDAVTVVNGHRLYGSISMTSYLFS